MLIIVCQREFCQPIVMLLANFCHAYGKVLPIGWQNLANLSARKTHTVPYTFIIV